MGGIFPERLEVWKVDTKKGPEETFNVTSELWAVAASSAGESLFGITKDGTLYKWQKGQKEPVASLDGFWPIATGIQYSDDGKRLQLYSNHTYDLENIIEFDKINNVLELDSQKYTLTNVFQYPYNSKKGFARKTAISLDKTLAALHYYDSRSISLVDADTGKFFRNIPVKTKFDYFDFSPDGKHLIVHRMLDGSVKVLDISNGNVLQEFTLDESDYTKEVRLSGDKSTALVWDYYTIKAVQTNTFESIHDQAIPYFIVETGISVDGTKAAILTGEGKLLIWDITTNSLLPEYDLKQKDYQYLMRSHMVFTPDNTQLTLTTRDGLIRLFNIAP